MPTTSRKALTDQAGYGLRGGWHHLTRPALPVARHEVGADDVAMPGGVVLVAGVVGEVGPVPDDHVLPVDRLPVQVLVDLDLGAVRLRVVVDLPGAVAQ